MALVLLLDDNGDLRDVLKEVIEAIGYQVVAGENGHAGLDVLTRGDAIDIAICDINMPDMDGFTFLKRLRENPQWREIYFVAMSGLKEDKRQALAEGADSYIPKPFNVPQLTAALAPFHERTKPTTPAAPVPPPTESSTPNEPADESTTPDEPAPQ
jgi:CheY-like chemotaxis protein